jgi:Zn-dependent peptidase ImmA (M78 family)
MDMESIRFRAGEVSAKYNPQGLVPFPYIEMANMLGDLEIIFGLTMSEKASGAIFMQEADDGSSKFVIAVNPAGRSEARQYFTVGHELGHYFLHRDWLTARPNKGIIDYSDVLEGSSMLWRPDIRPTDIEQQQKEKEANNFAAELLMPAEKVKEYWDVSRGDIVETANAFKVSKSAMAIRLERLGII